MLFERENIRTHIMSIIAQQLSLPIEKVHDDDTLESLGADSLDRVEMIMKLEEHFSIEINDDEAEKIKTVAQLVDYIIFLTTKPNLS